MSYVAITSNCLRHREFINRLQKIVDLSLVVVAKKDQGDNGDIFTASERKFFSGPKEDIVANIVECTAIQVNSRRMSEMIASVDPDVCFVFGAPLLKKHIFEIPKRGCINIHTGLVQYHRGVDSTYWAIDEGKLDRIGATLHYIDSSIDGGDIISQSRTTDLNVEDSAEDIFMKTCIAGFDILEKNIYNIKSDTVESYPIPKRGRLYQIKDMDYEKVLEIRYKTPYLLKEFLNGNNS